MNDIKQTYNLQQYLQYIACLSSRLLWTTGANKKDLQTKLYAIYGVGKNTQDSKITISKVATFLSLSNFQIN